MTQCNEDDLAPACERYWVVKGLFPRCKVVALVNRPEGDRPVPALFPPQAIILNSVLRAGLTLSTIRALSSPPVRVPGQARCHSLA